MSEIDTSSKKKLSTTHVILIIGIVVIVAIVAIVGFMLLNKETEPAPVMARPGTGNLVADETFDPNAMIQKAAENMFEVKMNADWFFPDGASPAKDAYVANSTANHAPFYFDVILEDTEEVIYTSPIITLGSAVKNFTLTNPPPKGDYNCICRFNLLADDNTVANVVSVTARVHIES